MTDAIINRLFFHIGASPSRSTRKKRSILDGDSVETNAIQVVDQNGTVGKLEDPYEEDKGYEDKILPDDFER